MSSNRKRVLVKLSDGRDVGVYGFRAEVFVGDVIALEGMQNIMRVTDVTDAPPSIAATHGVASLVTVGYHPVVVTGNMTIKYPVEGAERVIAGVHAPEPEEYRAFGEDAHEDDNEDDYDGDSEEEDAGEDAGDGEEEDRAFGEDDYDGDSDDAGEDAGEEKDVCDGAEIVTDSDGLDDGEGEPQP